MRLRPPSRGSARRASRSLTLGRSEHENGWVPLRFHRHEEKWRDFDHPSPAQRKAYETFKDALLDDPFAIRASPVTDDVTEAEPRLGQPFLAVVPGSLSDETVTVCTFAIAATRVVACLGLDNVVISALVDPLPDEPPDT